MAAKVRPTPRQALVAEMRRVVPPLMRGLGFENPPNGSPEWFPSTRPNTWVRKRMGYVDEIYIWWARYGRPAFGISLRTDQAERMWSGDASLPRPRLTDLNVLAEHRCTLFGRYTKTEFSLRLFSVQKLVALAVARLAEADEYLRTGEPSRHIMPAMRDVRIGDDPTIDYPIFWWREGETGAASLQFHEEKQARRREKREKGRTTPPTRGENT